MLIYQSVVSSANYFAAVCWGRRISVGDVNRINKLLGKAETVIGHNMETFESLRDKRSLNKLLYIMDDPFPPMIQYSHS